MEPLSIWNLHRLLSSCCCYQISFAIQAYNKGRWRLHLMPFGLRPYRMSGPCMGPAMSPLGWGAGGAREVCLKSRAPVGQCLLRRCRTHNLVRAPRACLERATVGSRAAGWRRFEVERWAKPTARRAKLAEGLPLWGGGGEGAQAARTLPCDLASAERGFVRRMAASYMARRGLSLMAG